MAELSIVASVIGIVGAGTKLSIAIFDFAASVGRAGRDLQHVAIEISDLCSVLKQLQILLEHAHFQTSRTAIEAAERIIRQCSRVFAEIGEVVGELRRARGDDLFPSVDFVSKVKWTFSKKAKVLMLRSTLEACKSTLNVMLTTLLLAERVSQRRLSGNTTLVEEEQDKVVTQSLLMAQQCAVEQLEQYEDEVEKEEEAAMLLPVLQDAPTRPDVKPRRKSRGRLVGMFSGLSVVTDIPTPPAEPPKPQRAPTRAERASLWLDAILAPLDESTDPHPGRLRLRRLSSIDTEEAPLQLLRKWTDQAEHLDHGDKFTPTSQILGTPELWRDSKFSFSGSKLSSVVEGNVQGIEQSPITGASKTPSDLVSPKTTRVQSIGYHVVLGVNGSLESASTAVTSTQPDDSYEAITRSIMQEHCASGTTDEVELCISYGGKTRVLTPSDRPLEVLRYFDGLELDPRFFLRRVQPP